ncbi:hypothetical protein J0895_23620 [Phormidium pseudopriestleyi FRX01]|uniref:Uncharacterized protein n=1 Tax=Phormidium pseudopriestleyi FRX01 TaxID=1759528 RepID=A0ABS3FY26_9CYAN|nr:hypothetical protein [Phormidium pseudopriestleyi]MBO0352015.1 hypothetical protein [Phormidium pseudopriestleyi FRX01]
MGYRGDQECEHLARYLSGRRVFLKHFEDRISLKISHPDVKDKVSYRRVIQLQVQRYKKALVQGIPYESFIRVD